MDKQINYILEVARCAGISKAANNLYITPSALSKYIRTKEEELGVQLFNRTGKNFNLTYAGEQYIGYLEQMQDLKNKMDNEMMRIASLYKGRLRVGFQLSISDVVLSKIIPAFFSEYPNIQIMMEENTANELIQMLRKNELDIVVTSVGSETGEFQSYLIKEGEIILIAPRSFELAEVAVNKEKFSYPWLDFSILEQHLIVALDNGLYLRKYMDQYFTANKGEPKINMVVKSTHTALMGVRNGLGMTFTFDLLVNHTEIGNDVDIFSFGENPIKNNFVLLIQKGTIFSKEVNCFFEVCKKYL